MGIKSTRRSPNGTLDTIQSSTTMALKIVILAALIAVARAGLIGAPVAAAPIATSYAASPLIHQAPVSYHAPISYSAPIYHAPVAKVAAPLAYAAPVAKAVVDADYDPNPQYHYGYDVQDGLTGDSKSQVESRSGDVVQGSYSLTDPDGFRRTVDYTADPVNGFNAVVRREPLVAAPAVAKVAAPIGYAAPLQHIASPLAYAAPVAKIAAPIGYAAPVAKIGAPLTYSTSVLH